MGTNQFFGRLPSLYFALSIRCCSLGHFELALLLASTIKQQEAGAHRNLSLDTFLRLLSLSLEELVERQLVVVELLCVLDQVHVLHWLVAR